MNHIISILHGYRQAIQEAVPAVLAYAAVETTAFEFETLFTLTHAPRQVESSLLNQTPTSETENVGLRGNV